MPTNPATIMVLSYAIGFVVSIIIWTGVIVGIFFSWLSALGLFAFALAVGYLWFGVAMKGP